jgi:ABC-type dipeptide/oligopeptide/nickel transport system ATPase component
MINLKQNISGVKFDVSFQDKICVFRGCSGSGKSYMCKALNSYFKYNNVSSACINYKLVDFNVESFVYKLCSNKEIVFIDDAELYLTPDMFQKLRDTNDIIVLCISSTWGLNMKEAHLYKVDFDGKLLKTVRL